MEHLTEVQPGRPRTASRTSFGILETVLPDICCRPLRTFLVHHLSTAGPETGDGGHKGFARSHPCIGGRWLHGDGDYSAASRMPSSATMLHGKQKTRRTQPVLWPPPVLAAVADALVALPVGPRSARRRLAACTGGNSRHCRRRRTRGRLLGAAALRNWFVAFSSEADSYPGNPAANMTGPCPAAPRLPTTANSSRVI